MPVSLLTLAKRNFAPRQLTDAEQKLFATSESGRLFPRDEEFDCFDVGSAPESSVIHAECLVWLCTDREASSLVTHRGIQINSVLVDGILDLTHAVIPFPIEATNCVFTSDIFLIKARMRSFYLYTCLVRNLNAVDAQIEGMFYFGNVFQAESQIIVERAKINGDLIFDGAELQDPHGISLSAGLIEVSGNVKLRRVKAIGATDFWRAKIQGDLDFDCCRMTNPKNFNRSYFAIRLDGAKIEGSLNFFNHCQIEGPVSLRGSEIKNYFVWREFSSVTKVILDLRLAHVGTLLDDEQSWPEKDNLFLDGFTYDRIDDVAPIDADMRTRWLHLQPHDRFFEQPYDQLTSVLRRMGHDETAWEVFRAKNPDRARVTRLFSQNWWWYNVFGKLIGYGYMPGRAFCISLALIGLGCVLFQLGFMFNLISPTSENAYIKDAAGRAVLQNEKHIFSKEYPKFNSFVYSLESFTPLLKLDQSANWTPNANRGRVIHLELMDVTMGGLLRGYLWFHIIAGWILTSLWIGAITGLAKR